jgi:hypothetical protein
MEKKKQSRETQSNQYSFESAYPNIARWVLDGWIEIGYESYTDSFVRALDEGGMVWEGKRKYPTLEDALKDLDRGVAKWFEENGG